MAAFLNLARVFSDKPIQYDQIRQALHIETSEVERWVVKAKGEKLLTAKIDQMHRVVTVTMCSTKGFDGWLKFFEIFADSMLRK